MANTVRLTPVTIESRTPRAATVAPCADDRHLPVEGAGPDGGDERRGRRRQGVGPGGEQGPEATTAT
jgi:hypothetical protein